MTDIKDDLRQIPLLSHLDEAQLQCIADKGAEVHLPAGTVIAKRAIRRMGSLSFESMAHCLTSVPTVKS